MGSKVVMTRYQIALLRYVDHDRGEMLNLGTVVYAPEARYVRVLWPARLDRIASAFPSADLDGLRAEMARIASGIQQISNFGGDVCWALSRILHTADGPIVPGGYDVSASDEPLDAVLLDLHGRMVET